MLQTLDFFFYWGYDVQESPVEEYVNNTGLLWDLAAKERALVVFAEHRYFGESIPDVNGMSQCMSYLSSEEALADYASLSNRMRREWGAEESAVIAFGGSYGGMLAAWMRILYPSAVDGGITQPFVFRCSFANTIYPFLCGSHFCLRSGVGISSG